MGYVCIATHSCLGRFFKVFSHHFSNETQVTCVVVNTCNISAGEGIFPCVFLHLIPFRFITDSC